jgi:hypothetical protein
MERRKENSRKYFRQGETWGFIGENEGKIFERGTTGDAKIENLRGGKRGKTRGCERLPWLAR